METFSSCGQLNKLEFAAPMEAKCPMCEGYHLIEVVPRNRYLVFQDRYFMCGNCGYATKRYRTLIKEIPNGDTDN